MAQLTQQLSAQAHPLQQFQQFQLQQSQQSQTTASGSQMSATSSSTPIFIDSDDREIIILRSRSWATTPRVETDILVRFGDIAIRGTSVDDRSPVRSRRSTPVIEENIMDIAQYAINFSPRICGQNTKNIRSHWSGGSMRTIQVISEKLGIQSG